MKAQASLGVHTVSPEPSLFAHMIHGHRGIFRLRAKNVAILKGCACAIKDHKSQDVRVSFLVKWLNSTFSPSLLLGEYSELFLQFQYIFGLFIFILGEADQLCLLSQPQLL